MHLVDQIKEKARKNQQTVVLPESYDERMLYAAEKIVREGLAKLVILGDPAKIQAEATAKGINLQGVELLNPATSPKLEQYVANFVELRKSKGMTADEARKLLTAEDNLYYAGMMVRNGDAGGEVAGATGTTGNVLKAAFQTVGPAPGIKTVSSYFFMITKTKGSAKTALFCLPTAPSTQTRTPRPWPRSPWPPPATARLFWMWKPG